jgi:ATP phosphoribosyltransferase regulatory subunit HisZ
MSAWVLPDHIADVLPSEARHIEELRRSLLDTARGYGYELVMPPMLRTSWSRLLTGTGEGTRFTNIQTGRSALRPYLGPACRHHAASGAH